MFSVVIPMAGSGTRAKLNTNKALAMLNNKPLFMYAYDTFKAFDCEIILVVKKEEEADVLKYAPDAVIAYGGDTRAMSVLSGVKKAKNDIVLIHDAARPFVTKDIINNVLESMKNNKCVYVGINAQDTLRDKSGSIIDRSNVVVVQTPQASYRNDLIKSLELGINDTLTDDISYLEKHLGYKAVVVNGSAMNFKITTPSDFIIAEAIAKGVSE